MSDSSIPRLDAKTDGASANIVEGNLGKLRELFPDAFTESSSEGEPRWKVDFDSLRELLGDDIEDKPERYSFTWNGKSRAKLIANTPTTATLRPCPEESINWDTTENLFIEGDNLEVLKLLQKSYHRKVKMIYIDPPYNTGNEFIYPDKFQDNLGTYLRYSGQVDDEGFKLSANAETSGRYHTNWLNMMLPRLKLARTLLRDDGAIFISIDDHEHDNLRHLCDEVFGEENFRADISWQKRYTRSNNTVDFTTTVEHILVYARSAAFEVNLLPRTDEADSRYSNPDNDPRGPWKGASYLNPATPQQRPNLCYPIVNPNTGEVAKPTTNAWRRSSEEFDRLLADNRLYWGGDGRQPVPSIKMFLSESRGLTPINFWSHDYAGNTDQGTRDLASLLGHKVFDNPKPVSLLKRVLEHATDRNSLVLDFFAGSCPLAQAVLELNKEDGGNRRFIMVQLPETCSPETEAHRQGYPTIADIGKSRIRRVIQAMTDNAGETSDEALFASGGNERLPAGFKVFALSSSNVRLWDADFSNLEDKLFNATEHVKEDRSEQDLLYELLLKYGLDLAMPIVESDIDGREVFIVGSGALVVCLSQDTDLGVVEGIARIKKELNPEIMRVVFLDSGFKNDVSKTNAVQILKQAGLATEQIRSI